MNEDTLLQQLRKAFRLETEERLQALATAILRLGDAANAAEREPELEQAYRDFHSLKGAAHAVGMDGVAQLCGKTEELLRQLRESPGSMIATHVDTLLAITAVVERIVLSEIDVPQGEIRALADRLEIAPALPAKSPPPLAAPADSPPASQTPLPQCERAPAAVRVSSDRIEALVGKGEDLALLRFADEERIEQLRHVLAELSSDRQLHQDPRRELRAVSRCIGDLPPDLDITALRERVVALGCSLEKQEETLQKAQAELDHLTRSEAHESKARAKQIDGFLLDARAAAMVPFESLLQALPPLVRELASQQGKSVELSISGQGTEIDRRILEELRDVLTHLVRNAVDHGMEVPEEREALGKPRTGRISVHVSSLADGNVLLRFGDDGPGFDLERLRTQAVRNGQLAAARADSLSGEEIEGLAFRPGLSTSPMATDVSGHGLGLAVVRDRVERLGGRLRLENRPGLGLAFAVELPVATSSCRGILVRAGGRRFVVPAAAVREVRRVAEPDIVVAQGTPMVVAQGQTRPLLDLAVALQLPGTEWNGRERTVVALAIGQRVAAYSVDAVEREIPLLLQPLGPLFHRVPGISAVTGLADGESVPVLNPHVLLRNASCEQGRPTTAALPSAAGPPKILLVVEDSVTSRMLIKSALEASGYHVLTAVDGAEGYALLKTARVDLVVSDVEMPQMDGFQMTEAIRKDTEVGHVPVVLFTSLASDSHRSRGLEVGANAYIVKGDSEQNNLLETIRQLVQQERRATPSG